MAVYSWVPIALLDLVSDHWVAPSTPILSVISIPAVSLFLYPLTHLVYAFAGVIPDWVLGLWGGFLKILILMMDLLPLGFSVDPRLMILGLIFAAIFRWMWIQARRFLFPLTIFVLILPLFFLNQEEAKFIQLDVGQGDAAILKKPGRVDWVDVGSGRRQTPDPVLRELARYGVTRVDGVLLTHLDEDHCGGLPVLLALVPVTCLEMGARHQQEERGKRMLSWLNAHYPKLKVQSKGCIQNGRVVWFGSERSGAKGNEWMAGIASSWNDWVYLALGDGDEEQERAFESEFHQEIERHPHRIWKVGHHGSRYSSNPEVLKKIHPEEFWISVGKRNPYHHPSGVALVRLKLLPGRVRRTDQEGDLVMGSLE